MKKEIIPTQQTNELVLANYISVEPQPVADVIYLNWTLYNNEKYVNNGTFCLCNDDLELYNNDNNVMWEYVATRLSINYI